MTERSWADRRRTVARDQWDADRRRWAEQVGGYAAALAESVPRFVSVVGDPLDALDILAALDDTGLLLVVDSEGIAGSALARMLFAVPRDPLDLDPATDGIESHWDREHADRELARHRRDRDRDPDPGGTP